MKHVAVMCVFCLLPACSSSSNGAGGGGIGNDASSDTGGGGDDSSAQDSSAADSSMHDSSAGGTGTLGPVAYEKRLDTDGGNAPATGCDAGDMVQVPYTADYYFYGP